jgi:hypothetical protein
MREVDLNNYNNLVRDSPWTQFASTAKMNRLMLFREIEAVYSENHMKPTDTLCAKHRRSKR